MPVFQKQLTHHFGQILLISEILEILFVDIQKIWLYGLYKCLFDTIKIATFPNGSTHDFGQNIGNFFKDYFVFWLK